MQLEYKIYETKEAIHLKKKQNYILIFVALVRENCFEAQF